MSRTEYYDKLRNSNVTQRAIANYLGKSPCQIYNWLANERLYETHKEELAQAYLQIGEELALQETDAKNKMGREDFIKFLKTSGIKRKEVANMLFTTAQYLNMWLVNDRLYALHADELYDKTLEILSKRGNENV